MASRNKAAAAAAPAAAPAPAPAAAAAAPRAATSGLTTPLSLAVAAGLLAALIAVERAGGTPALASRLGVALPGPPAATKPFATFTDFFPFYMREHSQPATRALHYVGTATFVALSAGWARGRLVLPLVAGLAAGYAAFPLLRTLPSGLPEMALMVGVYLAAGRAATRSWATVLAPMVAAYGCAWLGHFAVEGNKPATFIYPSYSLRGDFVMLWGAASSTLRGLMQA